MVNTTQAKEAQGKVVLGKEARYATLRKIAYAGNAIARDAECLDNVTDESVATIISDAEETVFGFSSSQAHETGSDIGTLIADWRQEITDHEINPGGMYGISTGITEYTKMIRGLKGPDVHIIAGRPGMAKTGCLAVVAGEVTLNVGLPVIFFSLEMSRMQVFYRIATHLCQCSQDEIKRP